MKKISETKTKIINYLAKNPNSKAVEIMRYLSISKQVLHRHLKELIGMDLIIKFGTPPTVIYKLSEQKK